MPIEINGNPVGTTCRLANCEYSLSYSNDVKLPVWVQYAAEVGMKSNFDQFQSDCRIMDERVNSAEKCNQFQWKITTSDGFAVGMYPIYEPAKSVGNNFSSKFYIIYLFIDYLIYFVSRFYF